MKIPSLFPICTVVALAAITLPGCADRNKDGAPESLATEGEIKDSMAKASDKAQNMAQKVEPAIKDAGQTAADLATAARITSKVKLAIQQNASLAAQRIDVDTIVVKKTVALRGSVKNQGQKELASTITKKHAPGFAIANQLAITP